MIELTFQIDDIDYDTAAEALLPLFTDDIINGLENQMIKQLYNMNPNLAISAAKNCISMLPQSTKDMLVAKHFNKNKMHIAKQLMQLGEANKIHLKIKNIEAKTK